MRLDTQIRAAERRGDFERAAHLKARAEGLPLAGLVATCVSTGGNFNVSFRLHLPGVNPRGAGWRSRASATYTDALGNTCNIPCASIGSTKKSRFYISAAALEDLGAFVPALHYWRDAVARTSDRTLVQSYIRQSVQARKEGREGPDLAALAADRGEWYRRDLERYQAAQSRDYPHRVEYWAREIRTLERKIQKLAKDDR